MEVLSLHRAFVIGADVGLEQTLNTLGLSVSLVFEGVSAAGTDDYIFYYQNQGQQTIFFGRIYFQSDIPVTIWLDRVTGSPVFSTPANVEQTNRKLGFPVSNVNLAQTDSDITGLTQSGKVFFERIDTAAQQVVLDTGTGFMVPKNEAFAIRVNDPSAVITMSAELAIDEQSMF